MDNAIASNRRGFTLLELLVALLVIVILLVVLASMFQRPHQHSQSLRESSQARGIIQSMAIWANNNDDLYPLPSLMDLNDDTVAEFGAAKDTTENIFSLMLYNEMFTPEMLISPAETNPAIQVMEGYQYITPASAIYPDKAMWDPAFGADFTTGTSNMSFAHAIPTHPDNTTRPTWKNTFNSTEPSISTRGPEIVGEKVKPNGKATPVLANNTSNTLSFFRPYKKWAGNVAYNDGHAEYETTMMLDRTTIPSLPIQRDWLFWDELHDTTGTNNFLSIFVKAGPKRADFKAIWD